MNGFLRDGKETPDHTIAFSMGDPRGIGPEVLLKTLAVSDRIGQFKPVIFGCREVYRQAASVIWPGIKGAPDNIREILDNDIVELDSAGSGCSAFPDNPVSLRHFLDDNIALCGKLSGLAIEAGVKAVGENRAEALVTCPIDKKALNEGGYHFPGHTELLSHLNGDSPVSMMLVADDLRVVPATTHIALRSVPDAVNEELILQQCRVINRGLVELFSLPNPRIAICAMNPHLGDGGLAGKEDQEIIAPAVEKARAEGMDVRGPYSADTIFVRASHGEFDAVLAMYHDQAMIAVKMHGFGRGVNITLGLPFIRTSPDHGVALDIAGQGKAEKSSMVQATELAFRLARLKSRNHSGA